MRNRMPVNTPRIIRYFFIVATLFLLEVKAGFVFGDQNEKMRKALREMIDRCAGFVYNISYGWRRLHDLGNTTQSLCVRCAVRFFGRSHRNSAGILSYVKGFLCDMAENRQADCVQSPQAGFVRCCPCNVTSGVWLHTACRTRRASLRRIAAVCGLTERIRSVRLFPDRSSQPK